MLLKGQETGGGWGWEGRLKTDDNVKYGRRGVGVLCKKRAAPRWFLTPWTSKSIA